MTPKDRIRTGFDRLAPSYDVLARLVFGNELRSAQSCFLGRLPTGIRVLVVGGGSGWFLEQLLVQTDYREVVYQDISPRMLRRAEERIRQRRPQDLGRVHFVEGGRVELPAERTFDAICTHCFLDLFSDTTLSGVVERLALGLKPGGVWYISDFCPADGFPRAALSRSLLWVMYRFFRATCGIEAQRLPNLDRAWAGCGLSVTEERRYYGGMIRALLLGRAGANPAPDLFLGRN